MPEWSEIPHGKSAVGRQVGAEILPVPHRTAKVNLIAAGRRSRNIPYVLYQYGSRSRADILAPLDWPSPPLPPGRGLTEPCPPKTISTKRDGSRRTGSPEEYFTTQYLEHLKHRSYQQMQTDIMIPNFPNFAHQVSAPSHAA